MVDTGLHAKGWTREQGVRFFVDVNGSNPLEVASEVDRYCSWPGQACGYKVGHSEINRQRGGAGRARRAYDLKAFDDTVRGGNVPRLTCSRRTWTSMSREGLGSRVESRIASRSVGSAMLSTRLFGLDARLSTLDSEYESGPYSSLLPVLLPGLRPHAPTEVPVLRDRLVLEDGGDLGVIAPDGTGRQTLPAGGDIEQAMDAAISPDGHRVAFAGRREGRLDLFVMNVDGTERRQLTDDPALDRHPAWSPGGGVLLFDRTDPPLGARPS